jgi:hypothetical protein
MQRDVWERNCPGLKITRKKYYHTKGSGLTEKELEERAWVSVFNFIGAEEAVKKCLQEAERQEEIVRKRMLEQKQLSNQAVIRHGVDSFYKYESK